MVTASHTQEEYIAIVQRAIQAYDGLIELYKEDAASAPYFTHCLAEARAHRNGLQERLINPKYLADVFTGPFYQSIDHFLESHRGEYGFDMPGSDSKKATSADHYLRELNIIVDDIIRIKKTINKK